MLSSLLLSSATILAGLASTAIAFNNQCNDNSAIYWGQNSYGAVNSADTANWQKPLSYYCQDDGIDVIPIAFLNKFFSVGSLPEINLANTCNNVDNSTFPGTDLANCSSIASDIEFCQSKGKIVTLSLGGAGGGVGFTSDANATAFADELWNLFFGGSSSTRPFGAAVLDGIDLDIENGGSTGYVAFINQLQTHFQAASKKYYVTAAPQCVYPDANLGAVINSVSVDAVYVQFYNNPCGLQNFNSSSNWDFGLWDYWARNVSPNPNVKVYIGAPASSTAAGTGYVAPSVLANILQTTQKDFPSFGGVMMWDASQAYANNRYDLAAKSALTASGSCGTFTFPACSAPAFSSGSTYTAGQTVSYQGYIWSAKWWTNTAPASNPSGDWSAISACQGSGSSSVSSSSSQTTTTTTAAPTTTTTTTTASTSSSSSKTTTSKTSASTTVSKTTTTTTTTTTSASATATSGSGSCSGVAAWSSTTAYVGGSEVTYGGYLWQAKWWTEAETPSSTSDVWVSQGACAASKRKRQLYAGRKF